MRWARLTTVDRRNLGEYLVGVKLTRTLNLTYLTQAFKMMKVGLVKRSMAQVANKFL